MDRRIAVVQGHLSPLTGSAEGCGLAAASVAGRLPAVSSGPVVALPNVIQQEMPTVSLSFNTSDLKSALDGPRDVEEVKDFARHLMESHPGLRNQHDFPVLHYKDQRPVLNEWLKIVVGERPKGISLKDMRTPNGAKLYAYMETWAYFNCNVPVKCAVQWCLWGGTLVSASKRHAHLAPLAESLELPGGFAMTEKTHGSNTRLLQTTATYDKAKKEFVINTPNDGAAKFWIGGTANDAVQVSVFARLIIDGQDKGVHTFVVPVRDPRSRQLLPGVKILDCGMKMGLNGVDNGCIYFSNVRVPREALMNAYADVNESGNYVCSMDPDTRFGLSISELSGGRVLISGCSIVAERICLAIALRFASQRKQFGPGDCAETEVATLSYPTIQRLLLVPLCRVLVAELVHRHVSDLYVHRHTERKTPMAVIHALTAGVKAMNSWNMISTLSACRESCGGQGFRTKSRISEYVDDTHTFVTFEGANTVLMQQVGRFLLHKDKAGSGAGAISSPTVVGESVDVYQTLTNVAFVESLLDFRWQVLRQMLQQRIVSYQSSASSSKAPGDAAEASKKKLVAWAAFNSELVLVERLAFAYMQWFFHSTVRKYIESSTVPSIRGILLHALQVTSVSHLIADWGFFASNSVLGKFGVVQAEDVLGRLLLDVAPVALDIVKAFAIPASCLPAADLLEL